MKTCSVENCNNKHCAKGYCSKHYMQLRLYGKILERTKHDSNEVIINNGVCWIILKNKKREQTAKTKIDTKYYEQIKNYIWHLNKNGYVESNFYDENNYHHKMLLHKAIIHLSGHEVKDEEEIDHKDLDKLNNLEINLRICTPSQNQANRGKQKNNTSGYVGVNWCKNAKKWEARIWSNNKKIHLGYFDDPKEAAKAYNAAAIKHHGEFAVLNQF